MNTYGNQFFSYIIAQTIVMFTYCLVSYNRDLKQGRREALRTTTASENTT